MKEKKCYITYLKISPTLGRIIRINLAIVVLLQFAIISVAELPIFIFDVANISIKKVIIDKESLNNPLKTCGTISEYFYDDEWYLEIIEDKTNIQKEFIVSEDYIQDAIRDVDLRKGKSLCIDYALWTTLFSREYKITQISLENESLLDIQKSYSSIVMDKEDIFLDVAIRLIFILIGGFIIWVVFFRLRPTIRVITDIIINFNTAKVKIKIMTLLSIMLLSIIMVSEALLEDVDLLIKDIIFSKSDLDNHSKVCGELLVYSTKEEYIEITSSENNGNKRFNLPSNAKYFIQESSMKQDKLICIEYVQRRLLFTDYNISQIELEGKSLFGLKQAEANIVLNKTETRRLITYILIEAFVLLYFIWFSYLFCISFYRGVRA